MLRIFFAFNMFFWFAWVSPSLGQIGPDPYFSGNQNNADLNEVEELSTDDAEVKEDLKSDQQELSLSQPELREDVTYGAAMGLGLHDPWQLVALTAQYFVSPDLVVPLSVGGGSFEFKGSKSKKSYQIDSQAKSLHGGLRRFFSDVVPIYVEPGFGYGFWNGRIKPTGSDLDEDDKAISAKLRSGFSSHGPVVSLKLGFQMMWKRGFYIDYCLVGMGKSWIVAQTLTRDNGDVARVVKQKTSDPMIWGLSNIRVGWLF